MSKDCSENKVIGEVYHQITGSKQINEVDEHEHHDNVGPGMTSPAPDGAGPIPPHPRGPDAPIGSITPDLPIHKILLYKDGNIMLVSSDYIGHIYSSDGQLIRKVKVNPEHVGE